MPGGRGNYVVLDMASVKTDPQKTITYLNHKLPQINRHRVSVVFLGETHGDPVDTEVARRILAAPPIIAPNRTRAILERNLKYPAGPPISSVRTEPFSPNTAQARSNLIADMILDAFVNHDVELVYLACGSAHARQVFDALDKTCPERFTFIVKMSATD